MVKIEEMSKWNYATAWKFFSENAVNRYIPETELYVRSSRFCKTIDLRDCGEAAESIYSALRSKSLILMDGSSLNGKTTFSQRLAKRIGADIVDIDLICKDWIESQNVESKSPVERFRFLMDMDRLTDIYILENLEKIVKTKSAKNVILVGAYMEVIYRAIIAKTLGKYFDQVVSIYCCAKSFKDVKMMHKQRVSQFGYALDSDEQLVREYNYAKRLLDNDAIMLGVGMDASFIADIHVSDLFE